MGSSSLFHAAMRGTEISTIWREGAGIGGAGGEDPERQQPDALTPSPADNEEDALQQADVSFLVLHTGG